MTFELFEAGILQGLIIALVAFGVMIPLRILNFADLTSEGSYPLGGAVCACLILAGHDSTLAMLFAVIVAGTIGVCTAAIHLRFGVNTLLAGIILSTMLYSINIKLLGKPNLPLFGQELIFSTESTILRIMTLIVIIAALMIPFALFMKTEVGLKMRAVGLNPEFSKRQGISVNFYTMFALFLGNALNGLAGSLIVQMQQYVDIGMGVGILIHGLAALLLGESIVGNKTMNRQLLAPLIGAVFYQQIQGVALSIGLAPSDLKLLTGAIVLAVIAMRR